MIQLHEYEPHKATAEVLLTPPRPLHQKGEFLMNPHSTRLPFFPENLQDYAPWVAERGLVAPYGKCQCGCGQDTSVATRNEYRRGQKKGQPVRFIRDHVQNIFPPPASPNPSGLCMCGCGQVTKIARATSTKDGTVKGQHIRFVADHVNRVQSKPTLEDAFWEYAIAGESGSCWEWRGTVGVQGYGKFIYKGKVYMSHRVSYELHYGSIPSGILVLHKCDNPPCWNSEHLFAGTHKDNMLDMIAKGRGKGQFVKKTSPESARDALFLLEKVTTGGSVKR